MLRVLDREVGVVDEADAQSGVDLRPRPPDARRRIEQWVASKSIRDSTDSHRRLHRLQRTERRVDFVARLHLVSLTLQAGHGLLRELCDRCQPVPLAVETAAVLFFGPAVKGKPCVERPEK